MNDSNYLHQLVQNFDLAQLKIEVESVVLQEIPNVSIHSQHKRIDYSQWPVGKFITDETGNLDANLYPITASIRNWILEVVPGVTIIPVTHIQKSDYTLPPHIDDSNIQAVVNILLSEDNGPITFSNYGDIEYKFALLNTSILHWVKSYSTIRQLVKFPITGISYEDAREAFIAY